MKKVHDQLYAQILKIFNIITSSNYFLANDEVQGRYVTILDVQNGDILLSLPIGNFLNRTESFMFFTLSYQRAITYFCQSYSATIPDSIESLKGVESDLTYIFSVYGSNQNHDRVIALSLASEFSFKKKIQIKIQENDNFLFKSLWSHLVKSGVCVDRY